MKTTIRGVLLSATVLSAAVAVSPARAEPLVAAIDFGSLDRRPHMRTVAAAENGERAGMSEDVFQSVSCVAAGATATVVAIGAGGENLVNLISGGVVAPANRVALYIGLVGVVFASFCQIGQALTPLYLYLTEPVPVPDPNALGREVPPAKTSPVPPPMRMAHVRGVLSASVHAPPLRAPLPAQNAPWHSAIASAAGAAGLVPSAH